MSTLRDKDLKGNIFNIQKFSVHDGPGIRTLVFFKGCPLRCKWCSNPEGLELNKVALQFLDQYCNLCGKCLRICPQHVHSIQNNLHILNRDSCNGCAKCIEACPNLALRLSDQLLTVDEVLYLVKQDEVFYTTSGGGVTLGGGDPLLQADFASTLLKKCKEQGIHTAIESSGMAQWGEWKKVIPYLDLIFVDIKHMDVDIHKKFTGVDNKVILENIVNLLKEKRPLVIRIPLIPDFNLDEKNAHQLATFLAKNDMLKTLQYVELLPYHEWGVVKYQRLGMNYNGPKEKKVLPEQVKKLADIISQYSIKVIST